MAESSNRMLRCLEKTNTTMGRFIYTLKSHPGCRLSVVKYPSLQMQETEEALSKVLSKFDIAIAAQSTSASLEAYLTGMRVIVFLGNGELNLSPLRGISGVSFVSNPEEMSLALTTQNSLDQRLQLQEFFWLDRDLPRWRRLIEDFGYTLIENQ